MGRKLQEKQTIVDNCELHYLIVYNIDSFSGKIANVILWYWNDQNNQIDQKVLICLEIPSMQYMHHFQSILKQYLVKILENHEHFHWRSYAWNVTETVGLHCWARLKKAHFTIRIGFWIFSSDTLSWLGLIALLKGLLIVYVAYIRCVCLKLLHLSDMYI